MAYSEWTLTPEEGKAVINAMEFAYAEYMWTRPEKAEELRNMIDRFRVSQAITVTEHVYPQRG